MRYLDSWLHGVGAAAIDNLMEDAATAEISRSQVRQRCQIDFAEIAALPAELLTEPAYAYL